MLTRVPPPSVVEARIETARRDALLTAKKESELEAALARARLEVATAQQLRISRLPEDSGPAEHLRDAIEYDDKELFSSRCSVLPEIAPEGVDDFLTHEGITAILTGMQRWRKTVQVQVVALQALAWLASVGCESALIAAGATEAAVASMRANAGSSDATWAGFMFLTELTSKEEFKGAAVAAGAIEVTVVSLSVHGGIPIVQEAGCRVLRNIAAGTAHKAAVVGAGGIDTVLGALRQHKDALGVSEAACGAVRNLAAAPECQAKLGASGAIPLVVNALKLHGESAPLAQAAAVAIRNLSAAPENQRRAVDAGALEACVGAMRKHPDDVSVQQQGCGALWSLSLLQEHKGKSSAAGSIEAVVFALNRHPGHPGVQHQGCGALWTLAVTAGNQHIATAAGAVEAAVSALANHLKDPSVQEAACGAIANIAWSRVDIQARARSAGTEKLARMAAAAHPEHDGLQQQAKLVQQKVALYTANGARLPQEAPGQDPLPASRPETPVAATACGAGFPRTSAAAAAAAGRAQAGKAGVTALFGKLMAQVPAVPYRGPAAEDLGGRAPASRTQSRASSSGGGGSGENKGSFQGASNA